jgi:hypothetical protein
MNIYHDIPYVMIRINHETYIQEVSGWKLGWVSAYPD